MELFSKNWVCSLSSSRLQGMNGVCSYNQSCLFDTESNTTYTQRGTFEASWRVRETSFMGSNQFHEPLVEAHLLLCHWDRHEEGRTSLSPIKLCRLLQVSPFVFQWMTRYSRSTWKLSKVYGNELGYGPEYKTSRFTISDTKPFHDHLKKIWTLWRRQPSPDTKIWGCRRDTLISGLETWP